MNKIKAVIPMGIKRSMGDASNSMSRPAAYVVTGIMVLLSGCSMLETASERYARNRVEKMAAHYRPGGQRPALPELSAQASFEDYLRYAMLNNPSIEAAYHNWAAGVAEITIARSPPDPALTLQLDVMAGVPSIMPGMMFSLPGPGKLAAAADRAAARSEQDYQAFLKAALEVELELKGVLWELSYLDRKIALKREQLRLQQQQERSVEARAASALEDFSGVLEAQADQERVATEIESDEDSRSVLLEKFRAALGLKREEPLPPLPSRIPDMDPNQVEDWADQLLDIAYAYNPRRTAVKAGIEAAKAELRLARKSAVPDFTAGVEVDVKSQPLMTRPIGAVTLPIWRDKITAAVSAGREKLAAAEASLSEADLLLAVEVAENRYMAALASREILLLRDSLIPKAKQDVAIAMSAYAAGSRELAAVIAKQRLLLSLEEQEAQAVLRGNRAAAELLLCCLGGFSNSLSANQSIVAMER